jgi:hypothetical protein
MNGNKGPIIPNADTGAQHPVGDRAIPTVAKSRPSRSSPSGVLLNEVLGNGPRRPDGNALSDRVVLFDDDGVKAGDPKYDGRVAFNGSLA